MTETGIKRKRTSSKESRRTTSYKYVIPWEEANIEVCQKFLLATLNISQMTLRHTQNNAVSYRSAKVDHRGRHSPANKTPFIKKQQVHQFIKKLPALSSHYCCSNSTKKYLPSELRNVTFLYKVFVHDQLTFHNRKAAVSLKVFRDIFKKDFNLGFHLPKKYKCTVCEMRNDEDFFRTDIDEILYKEHLLNINVSKTLFLNDQNKSKEDGSFLCASFKFQNVLNTPHGNTMLLCYSRKYSMYSEIVYESGTRNAFCFVWGESDGNRGCDEVCTVMYKYLQNVDDRGNITDIALYCDSCSGQNGNRAIIIMLHKFLQFSKNIKNLKLVFLLPGHTYMPVDSVHGIIERFVRKRIVWAPSEWYTLIANARVNPKPLEVIKLEHTDFINWKKTADELLPNKVKKTLEGEKFLISQIRIATFQKGQPNINIKYSYCESDRVLTLPISQHCKGRASNKTTSSDCASLIYPKPLPISSLKYKDLKLLCEKKIIPLRFVNEYKNLKHSGSVPDVLAETDEEDETNDGNE